MVGFGHLPGACAIYGTDVMLRSDYSPVILEVNFSPDCTRACNYDPNFFNDIFSVVFTDNWRENEIVKASVTEI